MRDYFAEFLLDPKTTPAVSRSAVRSPNLGRIQHPLGNAPKAFPIKHHMMWALAATAIGLGSWKASRWFAGHSSSNSQG